MIYTKTYGITHGYNKGKQRWFVVCDGKKTSLHYAKADFAMKESEQFAKSCYRNFTRSNGEKVEFNFIRRDT